MYYNHGQTYTITTFKSPMCKKKRILSLEDLQNLFFRHNLFFKFKENFFLKKLLAARNIQKCFRIDFAVHKLTLSSRKICFSDVIR